MVFAKSGFVFLLELHMFGDVKAQVLPVVKPYDCNAEADIWEWAWTPDWKAWCCANEGKGCPATTTLPATITATTTTLPPTQTATTTVTHTRTATKTVTSTETATQTATSTKTTTVAPTTQTTTTIATTAQPKPSVHSHAPSNASILAHKPNEAMTSSIETTKAPRTTTSAETTSTSVTQDAGCLSECTILGESATCQARISDVEKQMQDQSAPCPAAHVVVMSQCSSCGSCLFKDVHCASKKGVSKSINHMFMYKKYSDRPVEVEGEHEVYRSRLAYAAAVGLVSSFSMVALWRRHGRGAMVDGWATDEAELLAEE